MNSGDSDGQDAERRNKVLIPVAMMFVAIGMMFVVLFSFSSRPHGGAGSGIFGNSGLGHWLLICVGIAFEIVGLGIAVRAVMTGRKIERR